MSAIESASSSFNLADSFQYGFQILVNALDAVLFYPVPFPGSEAGFPFLVLWLVVAGVFFTLRLRFANFILIPHAIKVVRGKYDEPDEVGEITHFQALAAAISGTTGLGNIAGVAFAVAIGGPGAVIWMIIAALFGTATKMCEVTIGHKYRKIDPVTGKISGGGFHYLYEGLAKRNHPKIGKLLAIMFAICCIGGAVGGGNMFQSNQTVAILTNSYTALIGYEYLLSALLALAVFSVLIGGIRRIAKVAQAIVPAMAIIYIVASLFVLGVNADAVAPAISLMLSEAFSASAVGGGMVGAMIAGFRRAFFSNEAGVGSAPIAHAAVKTSEPVREGCVALLEPLIDTVIVCTMTGLILTITGVYDNPNLEGVTMTAAAFKTVISWFPQVLALCVFMFAFSTMITWSYYGERAWSFLFGSQSVKLFYLLFCTLTFFGGIIDFGVIVDFGDMLLLSMAIPNLIGMYIMHNEVAGDIRDYRAKFIGKASVS